MPECCRIHLYHVWHVAKDKRPIRLPDGSKVAMYERFSHSQADMDAFNEGVYFGQWRFKDLANIPPEEWDHKKRTPAEEQEFLKALWEKYHK